jgi:hypothetical protein
MAEHDSDTKTESRDASSESTQDTSQPRLDWGRAEVKDGTLTVSVAGEPPDGWKDTFEKTAALLASGEWETVRVKKLTVKVEGVRPGTEEKLRHFLESVAQQANATHEPDSDDPTEDEREEPEQDGGDSADEKSEDAEMTERFRSFSQ